MQEQYEVFRVAAAVLHLGNVQFIEDMKESAHLIDEKDSADGRYNGKRRLLELCLSPCPQPVYRPNQQRFSKYCC